MNNKCADVLITINSKETLEIKYNYTELQQRGEVFGWKDTEKKMALICLDSPLVRNKCSKTKNELKKYIKKN